MSYNVRIEIVDNDTDLKTELRLPDLSRQVLDTLQLPPLGTILRESLSFTDSTARPA